MDVESEKNWANTNGGTRDRSTREDTHMPLTNDDGVEEGSATGVLELFELFECLVKRRN
jgi:hypothetical protein